MNVPATRKAFVVCAALAWLAFGLPSWGQIGDGPLQLPDPVPPPVPKPKPPEQAEAYESVLPDESEELPWGIPAELLAAVQNKAEVYRDFATQFYCSETARTAEYDAQGEVSKERRRDYDYLLVRDTDGFGVREYRQERGDGRSRGTVEDPDSFPPAYEWVFMFSRFHEPYFSYRHVDKRFDGFDLVHEIQFKGSIPFTNGRDIRQWEGTVLIDAFTYAPIEIRAEPAGQRERIAAMYRAWAQSFNIMGFRTKKQPFGYRASIDFRFRKDGLAFPTEVRYDTHKAVSPTQIVPIEATARSYRKYRFTKVTDTTTPGDVVDAP